jgi:hypothetical protein
MKPDHLLAAGVIVVVGVGSGLLAARLPIRPVAQSVAAALASWVVGCLIGVVLRLIEPARHAGLAAVSFGVAEAALGCAFVIGTAVTLHLVLGWVGSALHPAFASWRTLLIGLMAAIGGVLAYSGGVSTVSPTE